MYIHPPISGPIVAIHMAMMTMMTVMMRICVYDVNRANSTRLLSQFLGLRGVFSKGGAAAKGWTMIRHCFGWTGKQTPTATPTKPMATGMTMIIKYLLLIKVNFAIQ